MRPSHLLSLVTLCFVATQPLRAAQPDYHLQVVPAIVYKVDDPGNLNTSSFVFDLAVICSNDCALIPTSATVELSDGRSTVERQDWTTEMLAKIKGERYRILANTPLASPTRAFTLPEAFDLRFSFRHPQSLPIDSISVRLTIADAKGRRTDQTLRIPIQYYRQKTSLIVPFRGNGVVGQDWITNGGHGGFSNAFAVDLRPLDENWAETNKPAEENSAAVGWGHQLLAPAPGTVIYARNDVPDNQAWKEPGNDWYAKLPDPINAYAGNCVIIDHGNSEYSVMMHMRLGSVEVKVGDHVDAGRVVGQMGNSGDTTGPHLHYQLQSGPRLWQHQSLPFKFQNIEGRLYRGRQFEAK